MSQLSIEPWSAARARWAVNESTRKVNKITEYGSSQANVIISWFFIFQTEDITGNKSTVPELRYRYRICICQFPAERCRTFLLYKTQNIILKVETALIWKIGTVHKKICPWQKNLNFEVERERQNNLAGTGQTLKDIGCGNLEEETTKILNPDIFLQFYLYRYR